MQISDYSVDLLSDLRQMFLYIVWNCQKHCGVLSNICTYYANVEFTTISLACDKWATSKFFDVIFFGMKSDDVVITIIINLTSIGTIGLMSIPSSVLLFSKQCYPITCSMLLLRFYTGSPFCSLVEPGQESWPNVWYPCFSEDKPHGLAFVCYNLTVFNYTHSTCDSGTVSND